MGIWKEGAGRQLANSWFTAKLVFINIPTISIVFITMLGIENTFNSRLRKILKDVGI